MHVASQEQTPTHKQAGRQAGTGAGRRAGGQAGRWAGRQEGRQVGRRAGPGKVWPATEAAARAADTGGERAPDADDEHQPHGHGTVVGTRKY